MKYFVIRGDQQYGPYSPEDLANYVNQGNIALTDQARAEDAQTLQPVYQVIGVAPPPGISGAPGAGPLPSGFPWIAVLALMIVTFGLATWVFIFMQASFVKKIDRGSKAMMWYAIALPLILIAGVLNGVLQVTAPEMSTAVGGLGQLVGVVILLIGHFNLRESLERYYTVEERYGLKLSGVMTFFFNTIYFQYHLNKIRKWKTTGTL